MATSRSIIRINYIYYVNNLPILNKTNGSQCIISKFNKITIESPEEVILAECTNAPQKYLQPLAS